MWKLGFPKGLARTLSHCLNKQRPTPFRALRRLDATRARHRIGQALSVHQSAPASPVPGGVAHATRISNISSLPDSRGLPHKDKGVELAVKSFFPPLKSLKPAFTGLCRLTCYCLKLPSA